MATHFGSRGWVQDCRFNQSGPPGKICYYFADPCAEFFPLASSFLPLHEADHEAGGDDPIGPVFYGPKTYTNGEFPGGFTPPGTSYVGTPEMFLNGTVEPVVWNNEMSPECDRNCGFEGEI